MLYSIGATWNPKMSQYSRSLQRGLAGVKGLSFAYRLNTWGPKVGPAMLPANAFRGGYMPTPQNSVSGIRGISSPLTWVESVFGVESVTNILNDAQSDLDSATNALYPLYTTVQNILSQAQAYDSSTVSAIQAKAQAVEAEAVGLVSTYGNLQTQAQAISNALFPMKGDASVSEDQANAIKGQASALSDAADNFSSAVSQLQKDMNALASAAQSGPSVAQSLESTVSGSVSTLTYILGGGVVLYFLAPRMLTSVLRGRK